MNLIEKLKQSEIKKNILNQDDFRHAAVLVLTAEIDGEESFIFELRAGGIPQSGEVCFPGGKLDNSEKPVDAALRETQEELNIHENQIEIINSLPPMAPPMGTIIFPFIGFTTIKEIKNVNFNKNEVRKVLSVPIKFFLENEPHTSAVNVRLYPHYEKEGKKISLLPFNKYKIPKRYKKPWGKGYYKVLFYEYEKNLIWGLTARIVKETINGLKRI